MRVKGEFQDSGHGGGRGDSTGGTESDCMGEEGVTEEEEQTSDYMGRKG